MVFRIIDAWILDGHAGVDCPMRVDEVAWSKKADERAMNAWATNDVPQRRYPRHNIVSHWKFMLGRITKLLIDIFVYFGVDIGLQTQESVGNEFLYFLVVE